MSTFGTGTAINPYIRIARLNPAAGTDARSPVQAHCSPITARGFAALVRGPNHLRNDSTLGHRDDDKADQNEPRAEEEREGNGLAEP
jgi:hypothetical protein